MKETIEKLISLLEEDNRTILAECPDEDPIFEYTKATDKDIENFEKRFKLTLPNHLKEFYKNYNSVSTNFMFTDILGMTNIISDYDDFPLYKELLDDKVIPIADDNGDLICVDTKQENNQLMYFSHEEGNLSSTGATIEGFIQNLIQRKIEHNKNK